MYPHRVYALLICVALLLCACEGVVQTNRASAQVTGQIEPAYPHSHADEPGYNKVFADPFLADAAMRTWNYLSSDWARSNHMPWSWRSEHLPGGDYANTTEIGLLALSWLAAHDLGQEWSPDWQTTRGEVMAILAQLRDWQTGSQMEQPNGPNAYAGSVFYQWYWISPDPPVVGASQGDQIVPSVDNAWLAAALITIRSYARIHSDVEMAETADAILSDMDFRLWFDEDSALFFWGDQRPMAGLVADYYSNENRIINFVARALGQLTTEEFQRSLKVLIQQPGAYEDIVVERMAYDGSYFTYAAPALFVNELSEEYGTSTIVPATQAQMTYAKVQGYDVWGLSDCYDIADGGYVQQGAPPVAMLGNPESRLGLVTPHASALALITPLADDAVDNLANMADGYPCVYHAQYGFPDSVLAGSAGKDSGDCSYRFSALAQEWLFLGILGHQSGFVRHYFYLDPGVAKAHHEMFGSDVYLPVLGH